MKATELRIGNMLYLGLDMVVVSAIYPDSYHCVNKHCVVLNSNQYRFSGIPLTEEWLLKFGFKRKIEDDTPFTYPQVQFIKDAAILEKYDKGFLYTGVHIQYVHQLQNLYFSLKGEELELK